MIAASENGKSGACLRTRLQSSLTFFYPTSSRFIFVASSASDWPVLVVIASSKRHWSVDGYIEI
eukprot:IDg2932t1